MSGRAFAICGPSGVGKDTLIAGARAALPDLHVVRRVITRDASAGGEDFDGVREEDFAAMVAAGAFALHWRAHGLGYGLPRSAVMAQAEGQGVIFNASRAMLDEAAQVFPGLTVVLVTAAPETLAQRLAARGRETPEEIAARLARAAEFVPPAGLPLVTIANDGAPEAAIAALIAVLQPRGAR